MTSTTSTTVTFRTTDFDTATGVHALTGEFPKTSTTHDRRCEFCFSRSDAPEAARAFRTDDAIQNFIAAKKTIFRLFRSERNAGACS